MGPVECAHAADAADMCYVVEMLRTLMTILLMLSQ